MTHNATAPVDAEQSKLAAHAIKKRFDELATPIKLNHAYEALAIAHRYPNWATMKASLKVEGPTSSPLPPQFKYGMEYGREQRLIAGPASNSRHIHAFSATSAARCDLLVGLSRNAIENGAGLFFFHAVAAGEDPSTVMLEVMNKTVKAGRRRDFFVIDASRKNSRLGNSCNILAAAGSPEEIAELFWVGDWHSHMVGSSVRVLGILTVAARHAMTNAVYSGVPMTSELLVQAIGELQVGALPLSEEEAAECEYNDGKIYADLCRMVSTNVEMRVRRHPMFFDAAPQLAGVRAAIDNRQIVVILVASDGDDEVLEAVGQIALKSMKRAIANRALANARPTRAFPDMVVLNDVEGFMDPEMEYIIRTASDVVFCVGDQCPTPPAAFSDKAAIYRSFPHDEERGRPRHYLEVDGDEVRIETFWG